MKQDIAFACELTMSKSLKVEFNGDIVGLSLAENCKLSKSIAELKERLKHSIEEQRYLTESID